MKKRFKEMSFDEGIRFLKFVAFAFSLLFYYLFGFEVAVIMLLSNISVYLYALETYSRPKGVTKNESQRTNDERTSEEG